MTGRLGQSSMLPLLAWLTGAMFFFYAWVLRVSPSVIVDDLMREFSVGGAVLGNLSALYFYGYSGMQIPAGVLLDRFGPRRLMTGSALLCGVGCVVFAMSPSFWGVALGRFVIGASAAFSLVSAMAVAGQWFPARRFALLSGLAMMLGMAGGIFGQAPVSLAVEAAGWRQTVLAMSVGGLIIAIAAWATVRDRPRAERVSLPLAASLRRVLGSRQTWLNAMSGLGGTGPILAFAGLWGVPFLSLAYGLERTAAAGIASTMILGFGIGAPLTGWLSDRMGRRKPLLIGGLALCTVALAALIHLPSLPLWGVTGLCFLVGLGGSAQIVNFAAARESSPVQVSSTTIGVVNGLVTGAGALFQPLIGWLLDQAWNGQMAAGVRIYRVSDYQFALSALLAGTTIGLVCAISLRETYCR
ncbi:MAG TPA: MFS transporter, partial [Hyphomicrobiaceae bacterium]|nr:MFS transporter [Hyphomicrobiaceae bacterium]